MPVLACAPLTQSTRYLNQSFLCVGRELLELKRSDNLKEYGCNNIGQFAARETAVRARRRRVERMLPAQCMRNCEAISPTWCKHGIPETDARAMARVVEALETLPALAQAAEEGTLSFYELRLLTAYATPESDEACVRLGPRVYRRPALPRSARPGRRA